jgi:hypothetical protein
MISAIRWPPVFAKNCLIKGDFITGDFIKGDFIKAALVTSDFVGRVEPFHLIRRSMARIAAHSTDLGH